VALLARDGTCEFGGESVRTMFFRLYLWWEKRRRPPGGGGGRRGGGWGVEGRCVDDGGRSERRKGSVEKARKGPSFREGRP